MTIDFFTLVRELLPELINQIIVLISADEDEQQEVSKDAWARYSTQGLQMAGRTLGELCRKFGERILGEIMPILNAKSGSSDARTRQGVALTLNLSLLT